ncbi:MAG: glycosyltransferase [Bacteroides uniformis]|jgi:hypothetical protein
MRTKILYVLVSDEYDIYLEQTFLSIYSLRLYMPDVHVTLLIDDSTSETMVGGRESILEYVTENIIINLNHNFNKMQRSRYLKTMARNYVNGDFLYIDSDTIITSSLLRIDELECLMGAVEDTHTPIKKHILRKTIRRLCRNTNFSMNSIDTYFNSGVLYVKDCAETRDFFKSWNKNWIEGGKKGIFIDQISLAKTNYEFGNFIYELSAIWNCQITFGVRYVQEARIIHYLCTNIVNANDEIAYFFQNKNIFYNLKNDYLISECLHNQIRNARNSFGERTKIVSGSDLDLMSSYFYLLLRQIYCYHHILFNLNESLLIFLLHIYHQINNLFIRKIK